MSSLCAPRRCYLQKNTPAELAIRAAMKAVEEAGCDTLLTDAIVLLEQALNKVGDYVDHKQRPPLSPGQCPACYGLQRTHYAWCPAVALRPYFRAEGWTEPGGSGEDFTAEDERAVGTGR